MVILAIGKPGSGKSTFFGRLASGRLRANPERRILAFCPFLADAARQPKVLRRATWYARGPALLDAAQSGKLPRIAVVYRADDVEYLAQAAIALWERHKQTCVIWFDEMADVVPNHHWAYPAMENLWKEFRHHGMELWCCFHSPFDVPPVVRGNADAVLLFRTEEPNFLDYYKKRFGERYATAAKTLPVPCFSPPIYPDTLKIDDLHRLVYRGAKVARLVTPAS